MKTHFTCSSAPRSARHQSLTWLLAWLCALALPALAGPSQSHFGSFPQGQFQQNAATTETAADTPAPPDAPSAALCPAEQRLYRKSLLITAFTRRAAARENAGSLWNMGQALPALVGQTLGAGPYLTHYQVDARGLPNSPAAQHIRELARRADVQLVLGGELLDLGMARPLAGLKPSVLNRARNAAVNTLHLSGAWDSRQRDMRLRLTLYDGTTGEAITGQDYRLRGAWNTAHPERTSFDTPGFWQSHYGQKVREMITTAGEELGETLRCLPLMARLQPERVGSPRILEAGAQQGIAPGDRLPLQRLIYREKPGQYREYRAHLLDSGVRLVVEQTHPSYSVVRLEGGATLHGEHLAVTPGQPPRAGGRYSWRREHEP